MRGSFSTFWHHASFRWSLSDTMRMRRQGRTDDTAEPQALSFITSSRGLKCACRAEEGSPRTFAAASAGDRRADLAAVPNGGERQPLGGRSDGNYEALYACQTHPRKDRCAQPQPNRQPKGGADDGRAASRLLTGWVLHTSVLQGLDPGIRCGRHECRLCGHKRRLIYRPGAETGRRPRAIAGPPPRPGDWVKYGASLNPVSDLAWIKCCRTTVGSPRRGPSMALGEIDHTCPQRALSGPSPQRGCAKTQPFLAQLFWQGGLSGVRTMWTAPHPAGL